MADPSGSPRRVRTLAEARELVTAWKASGQGKEAWCRSQGLLRSALMSCLYRVEAQDGSTAPSGFIELRPPTKAAVVPSADSPAILPITLELGHGMRLLGLDAAQVVDLVRALRRDPS